MFIRVDPISANSPVEVHGLDEVAGLDRDPAGLPLEALVVRHAGVDPHKEQPLLLFVLSPPLPSLLLAPGGRRRHRRPPMPLGDAGESRGGRGEKLFIGREGGGQGVGQVGRWQKKE